MKTTGYVRKIDMLGRLVIPAELRALIDVKEDDKLEFLIDGETLVLRKFYPACCFCGKLESLEDFHGKKICNTCKEELITNKY